MKEHLKNENALLAISVFGLLALAAVIYMGNDFARQNKNSPMATADYSILALAIVACVAELVVFVIGEYDVLTSKNNAVWKAIWGLAILVLSFAGAILYCLIGKKGRKS